MVRQIIWAERVQKQLQNTYKYILQFSPQNAQKIKEEILSSTRDLLLNPQKHPPDKYRTNNDGSFRAYELHSFRISYKISEDKIVIVRLRHTKMRPENY